MARRYQDEEAFLPQSNQNDEKNGLISDDTQKAAVSKFRAASASMPTHAGPPIPRRQPEHKMIDRYGHFYNYERTQLKTDAAAFALRRSR